MILFSASRNDETCLKNEFRCKQGGCIPKNWKCDGQEDCEDGSDEPKSCRKLEIYCSKPV